MLNGLAWNFVTDLLTIASVMTLVFWDFSAGLILLIPSVFPIMIVFGMMGWLGIVIDVGTIMTPTVALGVSVDDVVHFLIWYRRGLSEGKTRKESIMLAYEGCARAMYQSWAVLGLGLFVFALSSFVPTQRFGAMMFTLLTAALIGNLIMLPCVLASPASFFFGRRLMKGGPCRASRQPARGRAGGNQRRRRRFRNGQDARSATTTRTACEPESWRGVHRGARHCLQSVSVPCNLRPDASRFAAEDHRHRLAHRCLIERERRAHGDVGGQFFGPR